MKTFKYLIKLVKAHEARLILKSSPFKQYESQRGIFTKEIFLAILEEREIKIFEAKRIAQHFIQGYPFTKSLLDYDRLDLALALNHHYAHLLEFPIAQLKELSVTQEHAQTIAIALLSDFSPTSIRQDLNDNSMGITGEFVRYSGRQSTYFTFIEGKRPAQYQDLGMESYYESERFKLLERISDAQKLFISADHTETSPSSFDERNKALYERREAIRLAKINRPAESQPEALQDEIQETEVEISYEDYNDTPQDDYGYDFPEFGQKENEEEIELMDIDEDDEDSWTKNLD